MRTSPYLPTEVLAPECRAIARVDQTCIDSDARFVSLHRTCDDEPDPQLARYRAQCGPDTVRKRRVRCNHPKPCIFPSSVVSASVRPSAKYSSPPPTVLNGITATEGMVLGAAVGRNNTHNPAPRIASNAQVMAAERDAVSLHPPSTLSGAASGKRLLALTSGSSRSSAISEVRFAGILSHTPFERPWRLGSVNTNGTFSRRDQYFDRRNEPVAAAGERFDISRRLGVVTKCRPQLLDGVIDALLDIDEDVGVPQPPFSNLFTTDQLARARDEQPQELQALGPQPDCAPRPCATERSATSNSKTSEAVPADGALTALLCQIAVIRPADKRRSPQKCQAGSVPPRFTRIRQTGLEKSSLPMVSATADSAAGSRSLTGTAAGTTEGVPHAQVSKVICRSSGVHCGTATGRAKSRKKKKKKKKGGGGGGAGRCE